MRAYLKNYRQSPRKVRLVADLIRGKKVEEAEAMLDFTPKRATQKLKKLLSSAVANALHNFDASKEKLYIKEIRVDKGVTLHRFRPRAMGRSAPINKRTSNIILVLGKEE